jgi:arylsulfatase A-like enzyme
MRSAFLLTVIALLAYVPQLRAEQNRPRPNVLFIAIDDLNDMVGFLNAHPGVKTPNMDKLAARGVLFTNAHCAAPGCAASRAALLTGLMPSRTGVYANRDDWRKNDMTKDVVTLPDSFRAAGYTTKGGGKIYHAYSFNRQAFTGYFDPEPWDEYFPSKKQQMPLEVAPQVWPVNSSKEFYGGYFDWARLNIKDDDMADGQVVTWAEKQLSTKHKQPLFLGVGIYRPHVPWWTPEKYYRQHPLDQVTLPTVQDDDLDDLPPAGVAKSRTLWHKWIVEHDQWKKAVQGYLASVAFADAMIGRLIAALEKGPMADNTIIVLWSDHG